MILNTPLSIKNSQTVNRFVRSATCEYMADETGRPKQELIDLYRTLAGARIGIFITGYCYVMINGKSNPGQSGIYSDDLIPTWKEVTGCFTGSPSLLLMQIVHGGRQVRLKGHTGPIWAPSPIPDKKFATEPLEMTQSQIEEVIDAFIAAAQRAHHAGFHGVQLHVAHGYLLSQFLSPYTNQRTDSYGGNQENRTRIVVEIITGLKKALPDDFIISAKVNGEDCLDNGLSLDMAVESAKLMKQAGLDFIEVSGGMGESKAGAVRKYIDTVDDEGYFLPHARRIRQETGLITATVGGFRTFQRMEEVLETGDADLVSLCRPFIRQPNLVDIFTSGSAARLDCVSCNGCFNPRGIRCRHL